MDLNGLFEHGKKFSKHIFDLEGQVMPMWIGITKGGEILPILAPMEDKDTTAMMLRAVFKEKEIIRYVSMIEAWTVEGSRDEKTVEELLKLGPLSIHPDRREIIVIEASDGILTKIGFFYILRPENGKAVLSPFKELSSDGGVSSGRFANMLATMQ